MNIEQRLIKLFIDNRDYYNRFRDYIKEYTYSDISKKIIETIDNYYSEYTSVPSIGLDNFRSYFFIKNSKLDESKSKLYDLVITNLGTADTTDDDDDDSTKPVVEDIISQFLDKDYATRIANIAFGISEEGGDTKFDEVTEALESRESERSRLLVSRSKGGTDNATFVQLVDLEALIKSVKKDGYNFRLPELQISVGPISTGDFVVVGARPESGKTTFLASEVSHIASQLPPDKCVVWVNNEERSEKVLLRIIQATFQLPISVIESDVPKFMALYESKMAGKLDHIRVVHDNADVGSTSKLEKLFKEIQPGLIVFDTLDKVEGFKNEDRDDLRLSKLYGWARRMAKTYAPVLASSQADASAENQQWIYQHQLRGSKTDKQGEADVIITIGRIHDPKFENVRWIHLPKNKSAGCKDEKFRHGFFEVKIIPDRAMFEGYMTTASSTGT